MAEQPTTWEWVQGFGWVERPVEQPEVEAEQQDEPAAAAA